MPAILQNFILFCKITSKSVIDSNSCESEHFVDILLFTCQIRSLYNGPFQIRYAISL